MNVGILIDVYNMEKTQQAKDSFKHIYVIWLLSQIGTGVAENVQFLKNTPTDFGVWQKVQIHSESATRQVYGKR